MSAGGDNFCRDPDCPDEFGFVEQRWDFGPGTSMDGTWFTAECVKTGCNAFCLRPASGGDAYALVTARLTELGCRVDDDEDR